MDNYPDTGGDNETQVVERLSDALRSAADGLDQIFAEFAFWDKAVLSSPRFRLSLAPTLVPEGRGGAERG